MHTFLTTLYLANLDFATTKVKVSHSQQALVDENIRNKPVNTALLGLMAHPETPRFLARQRLSGFHCTP